MAKGFGIVGLVIAIIAIFVPVVALFVMWIALAVVTVGALFGERIFAVITWVVTIANILVFSPLTLVALVGEQAATQETGGNPVLLIITLILFAAPIAAIILNATGKVVLGKPTAASGSGT